jgi:hypothetical protein
MNPSYEGIDFPGGWQEDRFIDTTCPLDGSFPSSTDGLLSDVYNLPGNSAVSPLDEGISLHSAWLPLTDTFDESAPFDPKSCHGSQTYTTAQGYPYDTKLTDASDFDPCQSQASFFETDYEYFPPNHYDRSTHPTSSFSPLSLASPISEPSYHHHLHIQTTHHLQRQSPSPSLPYNTDQRLRCRQSQHTNPINAPPTNDHSPTSPLHPRPQPPRFAGDLYTPTYVRGDGPTRAGWCASCSSWLTLKDSAYWYHMHFAHGISCATGSYLPIPVRTRATAGAARGVGDAEALCGGCGRWVLVVSGEKGRTAWWRHAYRCKFKDGEVVRERKGKIASPRKVVARPVGGRT